MWSVAMDVGEWLRGLGLGKYEETFRANAIDAGLLPRLNADDLKEIGVFALGDRLRLLGAIKHWFAQNPLRMPLLRRRRLQHARAAKYRPSTARSR
jgi:hypothetical protein